MIRCTGFRRSTDEQSYEQQRPDQKQADRFSIFSSLGVNKGAKPERTFYNTSLNGNKNGTVKATGFKKTPYKIVAANLPPYKEVATKLVECPLDHISDDHTLCFFVRIKDYTDENYYKMQCAMNEYVSKTVSNGGSAREGDSVLVEVDGVAYRARVIGAGQERNVYLVDFGRSLFVTKMWLVEKSYEHRAMGLHLPSMVVQCQLAGVNYKNAEAVERVRHLLWLLSEDKRFEITLTRGGLIGACNLVVMCLQFEGRKTENFGKLLANHSNLCIYTEPDLNSYIYGKDELLLLQHSPQINELGIPKDLVDFNEKNEDFACRTSTNSAKLLSKQ